jgi:Transposase DDE domain
MELPNLQEEAWEVLVGYLPAEWEERAKTCGAMRRARGQIQSADVLLRLILLHASGGLSLEQAALRAREQGLVDVSSVALFKRLRTSGPWLEWMTSEMVKAQSKNWDAAAWGLRPIRILDATDIMEPGPRGTDWRLHYSLRLPQLSCDFLQVTDASEGETLKRLPVRRGEIVLADRGYSHRAGVAQIMKQGADVVVRLNSTAFPLEDASGQEISLVDEVKGLPVGRRLDRTVWFTHEGRRFALRLCVIRKTHVATKRAQRKAARKASKHGNVLQPQTLFLAGFVMVLTSLPTQWGAASKVLELYRHRWQVELAFKRLKSLLALGHVPKSTDPSSRAWMQAKILTALLIERLITEARCFSPWGFELHG